MNRVIIYLMGLSLTGIAEQLKNNNKKVQLIYAFNGVGKTRLSREFKELVNPKHSEEENNSPIKFLYYNYILHLTLNSHFLHNSYNF